MGDEYQRPTRFIDSDSEALRAFVADETDGATSDRDRAVRLFYAVRDGVRYDLLGELDLSPDRFVASAVLARGSGFCVQKAVLLAAACRAAALPCRLRFADVRNHLTTPHLRELMGSDVFIYHGLVEVLLDGRWIKATPAFDRALCERHGVQPIEFDGAADAIFHEFDARANKHMEYLLDHGHFADLPHAEIATAFRAAYPSMYRKQG
jgi:transglutaminase-like putative cysteine protease